MNELKNVSALVKNILEDDERARNTDNYLYLKVLENISSQRGINIYAMTVPVFCTNWINTASPELKQSEESRQKIQAPMRNLHLMKLSAEKNKKRGCLPSVCRE